MNNLVSKILNGRARLAAGLCAVLIPLALAHSQAPAPSNDRSISAQSNPVQKEAPMTKQAKGTFEVKVTPQKADNKPAETANFGRMSLDKQFHGDLEATSQGEMLAAMTEVKGSAGYVAMERVNGTLHGRHGTFALQHFATMTRGVPKLSVTVVPDSATGDLVGLTGSMNIIIDDKGNHSYEFDYSLPETH